MSPHLDLPARTANASNFQKPTSFAVSKAVKEAMDECVGSHAMQSILGYQGGEYPNVSKRNGDLLFFCQAYTPPGTPTLTGSATQS